MTHDRIHAREPTHHVDRWQVGRIDSISERDGHCVVVVETDSDETVELAVTLAIRDLFVSRLDIGDDGSPLGERVWFREHGG